MSAMLGFCKPLGVPHEQDLSVGLSEPADSSADARGKQRACNCSLGGPAAKQRPGQQYRRALRPGDLAI
jgi:hypothetical protein